MEAGQSPILCDLSLKVVKEEVTAMMEQTNVLLMGEKFRKTLLFSASKSDHN